MRAPKYNIGDTVYISELVDCSDGGTQLRVTRTEIVAILYRDHVFTYELANFSDPWDEDMLRLTQGGALCAAEDVLK